MCTDCGFESRENPEMQAIREALGAIATAEPAVYWLFSGEHGNWHVRREGDPGERCFPSRDIALSFVQLAVARCASYRLFLQRDDGRIVREFFRWLPGQAREYA